MVLTVTFRQYSAIMLLDSLGPSCIFRYISPQDLLNKKILASMLSTLPIGAVMFHWQVELNGSKKVTFSSERLSSVANKVAVEL